MIFKIKGKKIDTSKILDGAIRPIAEMNFQAYEEGIVSYEDLEAYFEKFPQIIVEENSKEKEKQKKKEEEDSKEKEKQKKKEEQDVKSKIDLEKKKETSKTMKKVQELSGEEFKKADDVLTKIFEVLDKYLKKKNPKTKRKSSPSKSLSEVLAKESFDAINRVVTKELKNPSRVDKIDIKALKEAEKQGVEYIQSVAKTVGGIKDDASAPVREYRSSMKTLIERVETILSKRNKKK